MGLTTIKVTRTRADISGLYNVGDEVEITRTILHVEFTDDSGGNYDMEVYEEEWVSEEYYLENQLDTLAGSKAISKSLIQKV